MKNGEGTLYYPNGDMYNLFSFIIYLKGILDSLLIIKEKALGIWNIVMVRSILETGIMIESMEKVF